MSGKYIPPGDMTDDQRADWEALGGAAKHPRGLLDIGHASIPGKGAPVNLPPSFTDMERLREMRTLRDQQHKAAWEFILRQRSLEDDLPAYKAAAEMRTEALARIHHNEATIAKLKARNMLLSAQLKAADKSANEITAFFAKLKKARSEAEKRTKKMAATHQRIIDLLLLLDASEDLFMRFTDERKGKFTR